MNSLRPLCAPITALLLACFFCLPCNAAFDNAEDYYQAQDYMLKLINDERRAAGAPPVRLEPLACDAALRHCEEMLKHSFLSHWNIEGLKPTRRYNLLGGFSGVGENVYYSYGSAGNHQRLVEEAMRSFNASEGHTRTMLDPAYTHVGIAFAQRGKDFYCAQEFVSKVSGEYSCPLFASVGDTVSLQGRIDHHAYELQMVLLGWEPLPQDRSARWLNKTSEYSEAEVVFAGYLTDRNVSFEDIPAYYDIDLDTQRGYFSANVVLNHKDKPGMYYLFVWLREKSTGRQVLAATATVEVQK